MKLLGRLCFRGLGSSDPLPRIVFHRLGVPFPRSALAHLQAFPAALCTAHVSAVCLCSRFRNSPSAAVALRCAGVCAEPWRRPCPHVESCTWDAAGTEWSDGSACSPRGCASLLGSLQRAAQAAAPTFACSRTALTRLEKLWLLCRYLVSALCQVSRRWDGQQVEEESHKKCEVCKSGLGKQS